MHVSRLLPRILARVRGVGTEQDGILAGIRLALDTAMVRLQEAGARDEALARLEIPRRLLLIQRGPRFVPVGRVWRLGVFLLGVDGVLHETGQITRAVPPGYPGFQSVSAEHRKGVKAAAVRAPFAPGEAINYDASEIVLDEEELRASQGPLFLDGDTARVRWSRLPNAKPMAFGAYLAERVDALAHPPEGA